MDKYSYTDTRNGRKAPPPLPGRPRRAETAIPVMSCEQVMELIESQCGPICPVEYNGGRMLVVILPEAWKELKQMIYFGEENPVNIYEQQYRGLGHFIRTSEDCFIAVVTHFQYIYSAERSRTSARVVSGPEDRFMNRLRQEQAIFNSFEERYNVTSDGYVRDPFTALGHSVPVLFGHTHPNLGVFFSHDDRNSVYATPSIPWVTMVIDPIAQDIKAMMGIHNEEALVMVMEPDEEARALDRVPGYRELEDEVRTLRSRLAAYEAQGILPRGGDGDGFGADGSDGMSAPEEENGPRMITVMYDVYRTIMKIEAEPDAALGEVLDACRKGLHIPEDEQIRFTSSANRKTEDLSKTVAEFGIRNRSMVFISRV